MKKFLKSKEILIDERFNVFFFAPPRSFDPKGNSKAIMKIGRREVFSPVFDKGKENFVNCYQHFSASFNFQFVCDSLYLIISPTHYYTIDGFNKYRFSSNILKGIKRLENNDAVRQQVAWWANFLVEHSSVMLGDLEYQDLVSFKLNVGIFDNHWNKTERQRNDDMISDETVHSPQMSLFSEE